MRTHTHKTLKVKRIKYIVTADKPENSPIEFRRVFYNSGKAAMIEFKWKQFGLKNVKLEVK